ncbi:MAG: Ig-like domain-containing protein, partial [Bacteroidota bacterium]
ALTREDTARRDVQMWMAREDTTAPRLLKITPWTRSLLGLEFSEEMDPASVLPGDITIVDTVTGTPASVLAVAPLLPARNNFLIATSPLSGNRSYRISVPNARDLAGLVMNPDAASLVFMATDSTGDDVPTVRAFSLRDSLKGVSLAPDLLIHFSVPMKRSDAAEAVSLRDSLGDVVPSNIEWRSNLTVGVRPMSILRGLRWHVLSVDMSRMTDVFGGRGADTVRSLRFETVDDDALSGIEGVVIDRSRTDLAGVVHIVATNISQKDAEPQVVTIDNAGPFGMEYLQQGQYVLHAFRDRNGNGVFDAGKVFPFEPAERFAMYGDTLRLRARWPLEGVMLEFR